MERPPEWNYATFLGRVRQIGDGRLLVQDVPNDQIALSGLPIDGYGPRPSVVVRREDLDELIAALMDLKAPPPIASPEVRADLFPEEGV